MASRTRVQTSGPRGGARSGSARVGTASRGSEGFTVFVDANQFLHTTQKGTGWFRSGDFYRGLRDAHDEASVKIQQGMVDRLEQQIGRASLNGHGKRPQRPGKRLATALASDRNREVFATSFSVGLPRWLDYSPAAEYWRQIEEGADARETEGNALFFSPWTGPWRPGGRDKQPKGYPHGYMPQRLSRGAQFTYGPFPAFEFSKGGEDVANRISMPNLYRKHLKTYGITLSTSMLRR